MEWSVGEAIRNIAGTISVVVAALSLFTSVRITKRKQSADLILGGRNDKAFADGLRAIRESGRNRGIRELAWPRHHNGEACMGIRYALNYLEAISVGIQAGIYDEEMFLRNFRFTVINIHQYAHPFIVELRAVLGEEGGSAYREFEKMATTWARGGRLRHRLRML